MAALMFRISFVYGSWPQRYAWSYGPHGLSHRISASRLGLFLDYLLASFISSLFSSFFRLFSQCRRLSDGPIPPTNTNWASGERRENGTERVCKKQIMGNWKKCKTEKGERTKKMSFSRVLFFFFSFNCSQFHCSRAPVVSSPLRPGPLIGTAGSRIERGSDRTA